MRWRSCAFAVLPLLLWHPAVRAQRPGSAPGDTAVRTVVNGRTDIRFPNAETRPLRWGFSIRMVAGPNREYTHPTVLRLASGSTAEAAGLQVGDTIVSVDGRDTRQPPMFADDSPGVRHLMRIRRGGEEMELTFVMPAIPPPPSEGGSPPARPR